MNASGVLLRAPWLRARRDPPRQEGWQSHRSMRRRPAFRCTGARPRTRSPAGSAVLHADAVSGGTGKIHVPRGTTTRDRAADTGCPSASWLPRRAAVRPPQASRCDGMCPPLLSRMRLAPGHHRTGPVPLEMTGKRSALALTRSRYRSCRRCASQSHGLRRGVTASIAAMLGGRPALHALRGDSARCAVAMAQLGGGRSGRRPRSGIVRIVGRAAMGGNPKRDEALPWRCVASGRQVQRLQHGMFHVEHSTVAAGEDHSRSAVALAPSPESGSRPRRGRGVRRPQFMCQPA